MIDHPIGTSIGRMMIDCLGEEPKRGLNADAIRQGQVLMASCPWNFASQRFYNVNNMLHDFKGMLDRSDHNKMRRVLFFCKKGERRSAAVLMVVLCQIYAFSRNAAKKQIEDMRPRAAGERQPRQSCRARGASRTGQRTCTA